MLYDWWSWHLRVPPWLPLIKSLLISGFSSEPSRRMHQKASFFPSLLYVFPTHTELVKANVFRSGETLPIGSVFSLISGCPVLYDLTFIAWRKNVSITRPRQDVGRRLLQVTINHHEVNVQFHSQPCNAILCWPCGCKMCLASHFVWHMCQGKKKCLLSRISPHSNRG